MGKGGPPLLQGLACSPGYNNNALRHVREISATCPLARSRAALRCRSVTRLVSVRGGAGETILGARIDRPADGTRGTGARLDKQGTRKDTLWWEVNSRGLRACHSTLRGT